MTDTAESYEWSTFASGLIVSWAGSDDDEATLIRIMGRCRREGLAFTMTYSPARKEGRRVPHLDGVHIRLGINV